ncbi:MAG: tetratricopeptide repeat protein [Deltaproteobacteria bacterium]|nr:tetratricopeptide repeat protein [Deltaproteobacteria bacterium]
MLISSNCAELAMSDLPKPKRPWDDTAPAKSYTPEEAEAYMAQFFQDLEREFKEVPPTVMEVGAQRVLDFLKGNLSWAEIFNIPPQTLQRLAEFGFLQYRTGRYEDAERFFKVLTMLNWNNGAFHSMLGAVYQRQKRHAEAIAEYSQAIELNPDDGVSWTNRGELQLAHGWLKPARADLEQALRLAGHQEEPWGKRAQALLTRLQHVEAKRSGSAVKGAGKGKKS